MVEKAIAEREGGALAVIPSAPLGLEGVGNEDLLIPRLILTQALSKFVQEDGIKPGVYVNSLTKEVVNNPTFIPIIATKYWDLLKAEGGRMVFETRVNNENDPRLEGRKFFSNKEEKADVNTVIGVLSLIDGKPVMIPFAKTAYKAGKKLLTMAKFAGGPFFSHTYKLVATKETKAANTYWVSDVSEAGVTSTDMQKVAWDFYRSMAPKTKDITTAGIEGDAVIEEGETTPF